MGNSQCWCVSQASSSHVDGSDIHEFSPWRFRGQDSNGDVNDVAYPLGINGI